ncbi:MAG: hypothetical protein O7C39_01985 [Bacteroidetes bacterium]|nr:hypothetical protein [Bacteroidota bacterium]
METVKIGIEVSNEHAEPLCSELEEIALNNIQKYEKSKVDGTAATVLLLIQAMSSVVAAMTPIILHYLQKGSINKIKVGDVEIENPSAEQVEALLSKLVE